jgi:hypothetical protein
MKHISADQLRDYKFDLLSTAEAAEISAHLETCAECRQALQTVEMQFDALEVLRNQPEVSEDTVAKIVEAAPQSHSMRRVIPIRPIAILAAAAGIAVAFLLIQPNSTSDGEIASAIAEEPAVMTTRSAPVEDHRIEVADAVAPAPVTAPRPIAQLSAAEEVPLETLRATQPFAPASNIELNVLPRRDEVQITIYNEEDLTLVREKRKLTLKRGWNWLQFMWSNTLIDPTSLELEPKTIMDQIEITQLVYPPRLNELARWTIFSEFSGEADFELTYFTSGLKWNAFYEATLGNDEQTMALKSFVRVDNGSGEDYEKAQTRLVVGDINLIEPVARLAKQNYTTLGRKRGEVLGDQFNWGFDQEIDALGTISEFDSYSFSGFAGGLVAGEKIKKIEKAGLSEYFLYTIEGHETIPNGWGKRLPSFDVQEIGVTNLYKYDEERWGAQTMRFLSFANTDECKLGETPIPNGRVLVFKHVGEVLDLAGSEPQTEVTDLGYKLTYVGASDIKYIPVGEKADLEIGTARKVMVEPKLMRTRTEHFEFDRKKNITGWDEITNWKIELTNARDLPVKLEITRATGSRYWSVSSDEDYEKYDADHLKFTLELPPRSKQVLEYELTVPHGTRQETHD